MFDVFTLHYVTAVIQAALVLLRDRITDCGGLRAASGSFDARSEPVERRYGARKIEILPANRLAFPEMPSILSNLTS